MLAGMALRTNTDAPIHPSSAALLRFFECEHLPPDLKVRAEPCREVAHDMAAGLEGPELTTGLRKLLEAKDCFVRAALED